MSAQEEQTRTLANYLPQGRAFAAKNIPGTVTREFLWGLAAELVRATALLRELREETLPDSTTLFLGEWEKAVGIPDTCLLGKGTTEDRGRDVLVKLASLGIQTAQNFIDLAAMFGVEVTVIAGSVHGCFPFKFPIIFFPNEKAARHTIIVDFVEPLTGGFPYTFPITFGLGTLAVVECLFRKLKPANVDLLVKNLP